MRVAGAGLTSASFRAALESLPPASAVLEDRGNIIWAWALNPETGMAEHVALSIPLLATPKHPHTDEDYRDIVARAAAKGYTVRDWPDSAVRESLRKAPRQYAPSPWGRREPSVPGEDFTYGRSRVKRVSLPQEIRQAMTDMALRPDDREYGGALDFEVVGGKPEVERIVAFLGGSSEVPGALFQRWSRDMEVGFHTHPLRKIAEPSNADIIHLVTSPQQAHIVVAEDDMLILQKTPRTPSFLDTKTLTALASDYAVFSLGKYVLDRDVLAREERFLHDALGLEAIRIPRRWSGPVDFDIQVIEEKSRGRQPRV